MHSSVENSQKWPAIPYSDWSETLETLHLWVQIVGKIRLKKMPWINHQWQVTLYVSPIGLTTGSIPYEDGIFQIDLDFQHHRLLITCSSGKQDSVDLHPRSVADFYKEVTIKLHHLGIQVSIYAVPNEMEAAIPFEEDVAPRRYDKEKVTLFWQALVSMYPVFIRFRSEFSGKSSPVHLFWGSFDLALSRFSGNAAPPYNGTPLHIPLRIMQEAYSREVCSCGFWPGNASFPEAAFYAYIYPAPVVFGEQKVQPDEAFFSKEMGEFILRYDDVRQSENPEETLLQFLRSTYQAAAKTAHWDMEKLAFNFNG